MMFFMLALGVMVGAATVVLLQQWRRSELRGVVRVPQPLPTRAVTDASGVPASAIPPYARRVA